MTLEASGFTSPRDVVFDNAGNMYVADAARGIVYRLSADGQTTILANNLAAPCCLAFDANGSLLVSHELSATAANGALALQYNGAITRISADGSQTLLASGFLNPQGVLVDHSGNILVAAEGFADSKNVLGSGIFRIDELTQVTELIDVGSLTPGGLALSSQGTLFFSGTTPLEGAVFVSGSGTFEPFVAGLQHPGRLATDTNALYIADQRAGQVWRVPLGQGSNVTGQSESLSPIQNVANAASPETTAAEPESLAPPADPVVAREFEQMWGYHGTPDYSKIPVTPEGVPHAPPGVTCVIGQVVDDNWWAIPNVTVRLGHKAIRTNSTGYWMLTDVPSGWQLYLIDGRSADWGDVHYPIAMVSWLLYPNQANVLPYEAYLPVLDTAHTTRIDPNRETIHTTPLIPGLEIHIPAHTTITSVDGTPVTEITTTRVPIGKPIYPMGLVQDPGNHFTLQPGGAVCSKLVQVVYNNPAHYPPGARVQLWEYAPMTHGGWNPYGMGSVTRNALQIVPDAGKGFNTFGCGIGSGPPPPPGACGEGCDCAGDPVTLGSGVFAEKETDFMIGGLMPINLQHIYHNQDNNSYDFGIGTKISYGHRLYGNPYGTNSAYLELTFPNNATYEFDFQTNFPQRTYICTNDYHFAGAVIYQTASDAYPSHDGWNYLVMTKDGMRYDFDGQGFLWSIRDDNNNELSITRSGLGGNIQKITQPSGRSIYFTYNGNGISQATDSAGRTVSYIYDPTNRLMTVTNIIGGATQYVYDRFNNMTSVTLPNTVVKVRNLFDSSNRVTNQVVADGGTYNFRYTTNATTGAIIKTVVTNPNGNTNTANFTPAFSPKTGGLTAQFVTNRVDSLGYTNITIRNLATQATTMTIDPLGRTNSFVYDANYNVLAMTNAQGKVTTFTYEPVHNRLISVTDPLGHMNNFGYDSYGNLTSITNALGKVTTIFNNQFGQPTSVTDPLGNTYTFAYSGAFDLASVTDPLGNQVTRVLDSLGRSTALIDALGRTTKITYSDQMGGCGCSGAAADLPTSLTDPLSGVTSFKYDAVGNLTNVTDALSHTVTYGYDGMNRLTSRTDQVGKLETYAYDKNGNVTNYVDRRGVSITFKYDLDKRRTGVVYAVGDNIGYSYDPVGRVTNVVDSIAGSTKLIYDTLNRVTQVVDINGSITYGYNDGGLRTNMTVAGQNAVAYLYDPANRLTNVVQGTFTTSLAYDDDGRRTNLALPNGINTVYRYDTVSRLTNITYLTAATNQIAYGYNQVGNRASQASALSTYNLPSQITNSTYDAANHQLVFGSYSMLYDVNGNVTNIINGTTTNQLVWSARNQLTNILGAVTANFLYDGLRRRITRTVSGTTEKYLYDDMDIIQQLNNTGTVAANYFRGLVIDEPWQRIDIGAANTNRVYLADVLGSTVALTDSSETISNTYAYEAFGATTMIGNTNKNSYEFTGRENDGTGIYYFRFRYYHPALGRFISEDRLASRQSLYTYASNDPLDFIDILGLRDYNAWETQAFLEQGYSDATGDDVWQSLQNIKNHSQGDFDFGNINSDDTYCVNGQRISAYAFGNFIAGFEGQAFDNVNSLGVLPFALTIVKGYGVFYHTFYGSVQKGDPLDFTGRTDINAGADYAFGFEDLIGTQPSECGCQ